MTTLIWIVALVAIAALASVAVRRWRSVTEPRLITCPETGRREVVQVDPVHRLSHAVAGHPDTRLRDCTRWPDRADCNQPCLTQIAQAPDGCRVRALLEAFYAGKLCASCGRALGPADDWAHHVPGLMRGDGRVEAWVAVPPKELEAVLASAKPICWDCTQVARVYQEHPELVTDRSVHKREASS